MTYTYARDPNEYRDFKYNREEAELRFSDQIDEVESYGNLNIALCKLIEDGFAVMRLVVDSPLADTARKLIEAGIQAQCFPLVAANDLETDIAEELRASVEVAFHEADGDYAIAVLKEQLESVDQDIYEMAYVAGNWKRLEEHEISMDEYWQKPELIWK